MSDKTRAPASGAPLTAAPHPAALPPGALPPAALPRDATSRRRIRGRVYIGASIALFALIVVLANVVSFRHYDRWDWTSEDVFTLSDRTRAVLGELDRDIDAYLVLSMREPSYQDLRELLLRYRAESERVTVHFVDPDRNPADYRVLAERFQLGAVDLGDGALGSDVAVVLASGDRHWKIDRADLVQVDFDSTGEGEEGVVLDVRSEQAVTGGLLEVTAGRRSKVCVTQGHGEWTLGRGVERDLAGLQDQMRRDNLDIDTFETRGAARVPEGCDAVFVVAPTTAFMAEESDLLRDYVAGAGGNLFVAVEPTLRRDQIAPTGLEEMLRDFGIRIDRALLLELDLSYIPQSTTSPIGPFIVTTWGEHRITRAFQGAAAPLLVESVQPVRPIDPARATTLASTSASSYAETDIAELLGGTEPSRGDEDIAGPVSIAVATRVEQLGEGETDPEGTEGAAEREGGRVVVFGDADFLRPGALNDQRTVNYDTAIAIVGWLSEREALIELPGRRVSDRSVQMTADDALGLAFRVIVIFPAASLFLGFAVWWNRRS
jgi:hypothetical protein